MEFQAIVVIGFRFANITNKPNKSTVIRNLMATCSFYREIVLPVCLKIRRDTAKCIFSSFPVFRITVHLEGFCDLSLFVEIGNVLNDTSK